MYFPQPWGRTQTEWSSNLRNHFHILKVIGEGSVYASPDMSTITLGVISEGINLSDAQKENNEKTTKVIQALTNIGIPNEDIKTADYRIEMVYDYEDGKQTLRGYRVTHMLEVTNHAVDRTGLIVDTAVNNGANTVSNIDFNLKNPQVYYNQALALALKDAQLKATELIKAMGVKLNKIPIWIQEINQTPPIVPFQTSLYAKSEAIPPIQPGKRKITATIQAKFSYYQ
ncbi:SIMPL domain-containing protein [Neobacillus thermocopriae]|uniref:SIMPL domain-containing protein n=1 Tax=Neobacillus thermocopriae TaxID=1215031 RepID=A0A6B3TMP0_9BACI|nr:SIMPL domain-containing protein [Neobacillus thermocopriae]MED3622591.1 SIMPL domain-containing protein [Neobacillus thermocopriae]MED3714318.1 SIMPL domain-containing protein [Neobacillus thermocopriae]NEX77852.1 SIMPL domain-containing protein [Neobacillus thermocopriae]